MAADTPPIDAPAGAVATAEPAGSLPCPTWAPPVASGATAGVLTELSGLAPSTTPGLWWTHNDSGDSPRIFLVDGSLAIRAEVVLDVAFAFDVEDIALGPDGRVWVADIGDNLRIRPGIVLWGVPQTTASSSVTPAVLNLVYPDGVARDAESLMIDPLTGDGFIVAKTLAAGRASVFRIAAASFASPPSGAVTLLAEGSIDVSDGGPVGPTAADISPSGRSIVVKTFTTTYLWPRRRGATVAETLAAAPVAPCRVVGAGDNEAIAFSIDGRQLAAVAEGTGAPLLTLGRNG